MKRTLLASYLLLASGGSLFAATAGDGVTIRCDDIRLPGLAAVAAVTGSDNAGDNYRTREVLLHEAERRCKAPGIAQVRFVPDTQVSVEPLRNVAAR